ncbi:Ribosome biogenesis protein YTM1 [Psilocybe cubensis]|uniref:Ribosome biogenesis protein YTM1 n=2 Tax=Psilocybe cubensis TaxID=181762 RepID=A0ACB8GFU1_PSICU|nr:Ribosome biogenesis protein YTM1 [Psilocybe cubensis]KAH9474516.1 Ribosome biogenesis protein YTM1 [Psilocybe cubensis]
MASTTTTNNNDPSHSQSQQQTQAQQPVTFTTSTPYPLPSQKFMIPLGWRRYQLSQLVNKALALDRGGNYDNAGGGARPVPFDFLVRGEILRGSLAEWCKEKGVGEEETLEIEYIESVMPPQKMFEFPHEDWVSAVSCYIPGLFLTTSYDGHLRAFDYAHNLAFDRAVHSAPVTSLCVVPFPSPSPSSSNMGEGGGEEGETYTIATASHDASAQILRVTLPSPSSSFNLNAKEKATAKGNGNGKAQSLATLYLHTAPIASVSANARGTRLITAGWDGLVGVWAWDGERVARDEVDVPVPVFGGVDGRDRKRRRVGAGAGGAGDGDGERGEGDGDGGMDGGRGKRKAPANVLKSHVGRVSKALFLGLEEGEGSEKAVSCGFDSTVRTWDVEYGLCIATINASEKPFLDLSPLSHAAPSSPLSSVLAVSTDRTMCMYDLRLPSSSSSTSALSSAATATFVHPSTPSCVASSGSGSGSGSGYQAITGAYDGVVRVWDVRSVKGAVASFKVGEEGKGKGRKVLSVDWARGLVGVAGEFGVEVWRVGEDGGVGGRV